MIGHKNSPGAYDKEMILILLNHLLTKPICGKYRTWKICGMGPPSSGGITILQILGILNNFNLNSE